MDVITYNITISPALDIHSFFKFTFRLRFRPRLRSVITRMVTFQLGKILIVRLIFPARYSPRLRTRSSPRPRTRNQIFAPPIPTNLPVIIPPPPKSLPARGYFFIATNKLATLLSIS